MERDQQTNDDSQCTCSLRWWSRTKWVWGWGVAEVMEMILLVMNLHGGKVWHVILNPTPPPLILSLDMWKGEKAVPPLHHRDTRGRRSFLCWYQTYEEFLCSDLTCASAHWSHLVRVALQALATPFVSFPASASRSDKLVSCPPLR